MENYENGNQVAEQPGGKSVIYKVMLGLLLIVLPASGYVIGSHYSTSSIEQVGDSMTQQEVISSQNEMIGANAEMGTTLYFSPERGEVFSYSNDNVDYTKDVYSKYRGLSEKYAYTPTSSDIPLFAVSNPQSFIYTSTKLQNGEIVATLISNNTASVNDGRGNVEVMNESREKIKGASTVTNIEVANQKRHEDKDFLFGFTDRITFIYNPDTDLVEWVNIPSELGFITINTENSDSGRLLIISRTCDACDDLSSNTVVYSRVLAEARQLGNVTDFDWEDEYEYRYKPYTLDKARIETDPECVDRAAYFCNVNPDLVSWIYDDFYTR